MSLAPRIATVFLTFALVARVSGAVPVASEPFAYAPGETLNGQGGGSGFSGPWQPGGFNASVHNHLVVQSGSLAPPAFFPAGERVSAAPSQAIAGLSRSLATTISQDETATVYLSFLLRPEGILGSGSANGFFGVYFDGTGNADLFIGKPGSAAAANYVLEDRGGSNQVFSGVSPAIDETVQLVVRADFQPGADRFTLYVQPEVCSGEPGSGAVKEDLDLGDVTAVVIYSTGAFSIDEIHLGASFDDVVQASGADCLGVHEPFDYQSGSAVNGLNGGSGWESAWFPSGFNAGLPNTYVVQEDSLVFPGLFTSGNRAATIATPQIAGLGRPLLVALPPAATSTVYLSLLLRPEGVLGGGAFNGFFGLYLDGAGNSDLFVGKPGSSAAARYVLEDRGGSGQVSSSVPAAINQTVLLVVRAEFQDGADRFTLYVNPDPCAGEPAAGAVKVGPDLGDVFSVVVYSTGAFSIDEVRLRQTFAGAVPADCLAASEQVPADCNQDGVLDLSDGICLLSFFFLDPSARLPCGDGLARDPSNLALLDSNGDGELDLSDAVWIFSFLFLGGPPPLLGTDCVQVEGCPPGPLCR